MKRSFIALGMLLLSMGAIAQNDYKAVDESSERMYYNAQWDSLIMLGEDAVRQGHDYYLLRYRLGIAYYEKGEYHQAANHLYKAQSLNSGDIFLNILLFKVFLKAGRSGDAQYVANAENAFGESSGHKPFPAFSEISIDGGNIFSNAYTKLKTVELVSFEKIYGGTTIPGNIGFLQAGLLHHFGRRVSVYHAYTGLALQKSSVERFAGIDTCIDYVSHQHQYYFALRYRIGNGVFIHPAFHFIYNQARIPQFYDYFFPQPSSVKIRYLDTSFVNFWGGIKLNYFSGEFVYEVGASFSNLNDKKQKQTDFCIEWNPALIKGIRIRPGLSFLLEERKIRQLYSLSIGYKPIPKLNISAYTLYGNFSHGSHYHGFLVFNQYEKAKIRIGGEARYQLSTHFDVRINYAYSSKSNPYFFQKNDLKISESNYGYQTQTINGGIIWKLY